MSANRLTTPRHTMNRSAACRFSAADSSGEPVIRDPCRIIACDPRPARRNRAVPREVRIGSPHAIGPLLVCRGDPRIVGRPLAGRSRPCAPSRRLGPAGTVGRRMDFHAAARCVAPSDVLVGGTAVALIELAAVQIAVVLIFDCPAQNSHPKFGIEILILASYAAILSTCFIRSA